MIEPEYAGRIGVNFSAGYAASETAGADVEGQSRRMRALGLRLVRFPVDDMRALDTAALFEPDFDILPCLRAADPHLLETLIRSFGGRFEAIEIPCTQGDADAIMAAARRVREAGLRAILGFDRADAAQFAKLGEAGAFQFAQAVACTSNDPAAQEHLLAGARAYAPDLSLWITEAGAGAPRHDTAFQARILLAALHDDVERVYWCALTDDGGTQDGLFDTEGEPKLLARLMSGGVEGARRIVALTRRAPARAGSKPILVTGGAGFIGANLADRLAADGHTVHVFDALARPGVERNLRWLAGRHPGQISVTLGDLRDEPALEQAASSAACVFHLAGQVAVTTSMARPLDDFDVNARGTLALLDAVRRRNPEAPLIFASTNKVYGDLADIALTRDGDRYVPARADIRAHGVAETRELCFHTPYGCSKGAADQYVLDYAHSFGLRTAVLRMSCIYGERQFGTEDQGWVAHFLLRAIAGEPVTIYGDGRQVRDVLHVGDAVAAYLAAWRDIDAIRGRAYNLGGGPGNAISLLQLIEHMEFMLGRRIDVNFSAWRPGDQRYFVADTQAIRRDLHLPAALDWRCGLRRLAEHFGATLPADAPVQEPAL